MLLVVVCLIAGNTASAQTAKDAFNAFRDAVVKQRFVLRNFSGEDSVHATWTGTAVAFHPPRWHAMGVITIKSAALKGHHVILQGARNVLVRDKSNRLALFSGPYDTSAEVEIDVDLGSNDPVQALPRLKDSLFYSSTAEALAAIPKRLQLFIPARLPSKTPKSASDKPMCDCAATDTASCNSDPLHAVGSVVPKLLKSADPSFTTEARSAGAGGNVRVAITVNEKGRSADVWLALPLGFGLDEEAIASVRSYVFQPATCHGNPVSVYLNVEVNFQIY